MNTKNISSTRSEELDAFILKDKMSILANNLNTFLADFSRLGPKQNESLFINDDVLKQAKNISGLLNMVVPIVTDLSKDDDPIIYDIPIPPGCSVIVESSRVLIVDPNKAGTHVS